MTLTLFNSTKFYIPEEELTFLFFKYSSLKFTYKRLNLKENKKLEELILLMIGNIENPRITYRYQYLDKNQKFGHGLFHTDGFGLNSETHRIFTQEGIPTEGIDKQILYPNLIWEFKGDYAHRARPTNYSCNRLLIRISESNIEFRNRLEKTN